MMMMTMIIIIIIIIIIKIARRPLSQYSSICPQGNSFHFHFAFHFITGGGILYISGYLCKNIARERGRDPPTI